MPLTSVWIEVSSIEKVTSTEVFLVLCSSKYPKGYEAWFIISVLCKHILETTDIHSVGTQKVNSREHRKLSGWRKFLRVADLKSLITLVY